MSKKKFFEDEERIEITDEEYSTLTEDVHTPLVQKVAEMPDDRVEDVILFRTPPRSDGKLVAIVPNSNPVRAFIVPSGRLNVTFKTLQPLVIDAEIEPVHDWYAVIDKLLPSREEIVNNVVLSMISAGALTEADLDQKDVRNRLFQRAYPYQLEIS